MIKRSNSQVFRRDLLHLDWFRFGDAKQRLHSVIRTVEFGSCPRDDYSHLVPFGNESIRQIGSYFCYKSLISVGLEPKEKKQSEEEGSLLLSY